MSNEEVVLNMMINRLSQLLEANESLRSVWSAEITEIILLGKGVLIPAPETKTADGRWILILSDNELDMLSDIMTQNNTVEDFSYDSRRPLTDQLITLFDQMMLEAQNETLNDIPDDGPDPDDLDATIEAPGAPEPLQPGYVINVGPELGPDRTRPRFIEDMISQIWRQRANPEPNLIHPPEMPNEQG